MFRVIAACVLAATLAGCATNQPYADDATIAAVAYREPGPATLTLYTMVNNRTGKGGHSSLMINASQRVIFDPAGSFYADRIEQSGQPNPHRQGSPVQGPPPKRTARYMPCAMVA